MVPCCSHGCFSWLWSRDRVLPPPLYPVCASCRCCWGRRCGTCCLELIILKCGACQSKRGGNKLASVVTTTCDHPGERERERERGGGRGVFYEWMCLACWVGTSAGQLWALQTGSGSLQPQNTTASSGCGDPRMSQSCTTVHVSYTLVTLLKGNLEKYLCRCKMLQTHSRFMCI